MSDQQPSFALTEEENEILDIMRPIMRRNGLRVPKGDPISEADREAAGRLIKGFLAVVSRGLREKGCCDRYTDGLAAGRYFHGHNTSLAPAVQARDRQ